MSVAAKQRRAHVVMSAELIAEIDAQVGPRRRSRCIEDAVAEKLRRQRLQTSLAEAGVFRYDLGRQGRALHIPDALMAATAVITDSALVTNNVKDYPMPGVRLLRLDA